MSLVINRFISNLPIILFLWMLKIPQILTAFVNKKSYRFFLY
jgi:hypothetical protein